MPITTPALVRQGQTKKKFKDTPRAEQCARLLSQDFLTFNADEAAIAARETLIRDGMISADVPKVISISRYLGMLYSAARIGINALELSLREKARRCQICVTVLRNTEKCLLKLGVITRERRTGIYEVNGKKVRRYRTSVIRLTEAGRTLLNLAKEVVKKFTERFREKYLNKGAKIFKDSKRDKQPVTEPVAEYWKPFEKKHDPPEPALAPGELAATIAAAKLKLGMI